LSPEADVKALPFLIKPAGIRERVIRVGLKEIDFGAFCRRFGIKIAGSSAFSIQKWPGVGSQRMSMVFGSGTRSIRVTRSPKHSLQRSCDRAGRWLSRLGSRVLDIAQLNLLVVGQISILKTETNG